MATVHGHKPVAQVHRARRMQEAPGHKRLSGYMHACAAPVDVPPVGSWLLGALLPVFRIPRIQVIKSPFIHNGTTDPSVPCRPHLISHARRHLVRSWLSIAEKTSRPGIPGTKLSLSLSLLTVLASAAPEMLHRIFSFERVPGGERSR